MTTRSVLGLLYILRGMEAIGESTTPALSQFGLSIEQLDPTAHIERQLELDIRIALAQCVSQVHVGLQVGQYFSLAGYGPLVMLLLTCQTTQHALDVGVQYQSLTFLYSRLRVDQHTAHVALVLTPHVLPESAHRFLIDGEMAGTFKLLRDLQVSFGEPTARMRVELPIAPPTDAQVLAQYQRYYGHDVSFGHTEGSFIADRHMLSRPMFTADPAGHALYRQQCDAALQVQHSQRDTWADRVSRYLALHQQGYSLPTVGATAQAFGLAERSLRYQLSQDGTSFRRLRDQLRHQQALGLLCNDSLSIERIAERLGYAETAAFIHAFNRWHGMSPHQYRLKQAHR